MRTFSEENRETKRAKLTVLVDHLQSFCKSHLEQDGGSTADVMIAYLREGENGTESVLGSDRRLNSDPDDIAADILRDVGELAELLMCKEITCEEMHWAKANLIADLERYRERLSTIAGTVDLSR